MIGYLAKSSWGLLLRRPMEAAIRTLPLWILSLARGVRARTTLPISGRPGQHHTEEREVRRCPTGRVDAHPDHPGRQVDDRTGRSGTTERRAEGQPGSSRCRRSSAWARSLRDLGDDDLLPQQVGEGRLDETNTAKVDHALHRLGQISGPGLIIYAITITAASTQWVMSLQPGWASTMFPVIFAINQFLTCLVFCVAVFWFSRANPRSRT